MLIYYKQQFIATYTSRSFDFTIFYFLVILHRWSMILGSGTEGTVFLLVAPDAFWYLIIMSWLALIIAIWSLIYSLNSSSGWATISVSPPSTGFLCNIGALHAIWLSTACLAKWLVSGRPRCFLGSGSFGVSSSSLVTLAVYFCSFLLEVFLRKSNKEI